MPCALGAKVARRVAIVAAAALVVAALPRAGENLRLLVRRCQNDCGVDRRLAGERTECPITLSCAMPCALGAKVARRVAIVAAAALVVAALPRSGENLRLLVRRRQNDCGVDRRLAGERTECPI